MLELLMLIDIEALNVLSSNELHDPLAFLLILITILLLELADLGVLATLNLALIHDLVVILRLVLLFTSLFATFASFLVVLWLLIWLWLRLLASFATLLIFFFRSWFLDGVLTGFFTNLYHSETFILTIFILHGHQRRLRPEDLCYDGVRGLHNILIFIFVYREGRCGGVLARQCHFTVQLLRISAQIALTDMVGERLLTDAEHEGET